MSTEDAIQVLMNSIYDAFDRQNSMVRVFIDLAKAFDPVDRDYLFDKLEFCGIKNVELQWFIRYLSNRNQCVKFKGELSDVMATNFGIPQGGVLSAMLYIIYVNDIEFCSKNIKYVMYADDTCVFYENKNLNDNVELLNNELENVCDWMDANRLTVNSEKSNYIIFSRAQKMLHPLEHEIKLKECVLTRVNCTKYLGICIDEHLVWRHHVNSLTSKLSKYVPVIYKIRSQIDKNSLKLLYNSLIYSNLIYCNSVWGAAHANTLQPLFLVQKKLSEP